MIRCTLLTLSIIALGGSSCLNAADWDRFRGPEGTGISDAKTVPVTFKEENFLWKTEIGGKGNSSPVISKGKVFLQTSSSDASKRELVCLDAVTGKIEWRRESKGGSAKIHDKNSLASSTAAADGERVYIVFWDGKKIGLNVFDFAGNLLWNKDLGGYKSQHGPGLSPIAIDGKVILNIDQDDLVEVKAFKAKNGEEVWTKSRPAFRACYTTPFVLNRDGKAQVVIASTAGVTSYDPKDGNVNWNWTWIWKVDPKSKGKAGPGGPLRNVGGPIFHNNMIFAISGDGGGDRHMVAIKPGVSGEVGTQNVLWEKKRGTPYVPMPIANGDYLYWVTDKENVAVCVEAKTGKEVWSERLGGSAQVFASPVMIDGKIYSIAEDGRVYVFKAAPKFDLLAKNELKDAVFASPAVADGKLFIRGDKYLYCIGSK